MSKFGTLYDLLSLLLVGSSVFFFYQAMTFLVAKDYIASGVTMVIGFLILRASIELAKLAILTRRRERDAQHQRSR